MKPAIRSMIADSAGAAGPLLALEGAAELRDPVWQDFALCAEVDPEIFFPELGGNSGPAKAICAGCPVRTDCLEYALTHPEDPEGVWGGLSEYELRRMRRNGAGPATPLPVATATGKHCTRCDTTKPAAEFWKNRSKSTGLSTYCISCELARLGGTAA